MFCSIAQHLFGLLFFTLVNEFECQFGHDATVGITHAHHRLVQIDAFLVDASEFEAVHDVVVSALSVEILHAGNVLAANADREGTDAVCQTFGDGVITQVDVVFITHRYSDIDGTYPVALSEHLQNHQVTLIQSMLASQRDDHLVRDRV